MDELTGMFTMGSRHVLLNTKRLGNSLMGSRGREEGKGKGALKNQGLKEHQCIMGCIV